MKIAIDISQIAHEGTGVARYTENLIRALCESDSDHEYTFFFSSLRRSVPHDLQALIKKKHRLVSVKIPPTLLEFIWNSLHSFSIDLFVGKQDLVISSDWTQPPTQAKKATVVHDLVYLRYPETVHPKIIAVQKRRLEWVKREVDIVIADSNATKQDLIDLLHVDPKKIHVVYPYVKVKSLSADYSLPTTNQYILSVGKQEPRKNIDRLINAFQKANLKGVDLVVVGAKGWNVPNQASKQDPSNVKFIGFVPDNQLYTLYKHALFFIYPSLYEGFGYPIVEAMSLGCPVATSNTSSLKEIAEGNALLFDPKSEEDIQKAITQLAEDEKLRNELREKGKKSAQTFSQATFIKSFLGAIS